MKSEIEQYIRASFRSVWALELLILLRREPGQPMTHEQMVDGLRGSTFVIDQGLENLANIGLVKCDGSGAARYSPKDAETDARVAAVEEFYAARPSAVRRIITLAANPSISAFADAFRVKRDEP